MKIQSRDDFFGIRKFGFLLSKIHKEFNLVYVNNSDPNVLKDNLFHANQGFLECLDRDFLLPYAFYHSPIVELCFSIERVIDKIRIRAKMLISIRCHLLLVPYLGLSPQTSTDSQKAN